MADLGDAGEVLRYLVGFWAFLFSPTYRTQRLHSWREGGRAQRSFMLLEGAVATVVGIGFPLLVSWLVAEQLLGK